MNCTRFTRGRFPNMGVLAIIAVLLVLPGYAQAPHNSGNVSDPHQEQTASANGATDKQTPIPEEASTPQPQAEPKDEQASDGQKPLSIAVNIPARRDWIDYTSLCLSTVLALITCAGVAVAWQGLPGLLRQAKAAEIAAMAAERSADAAKQSSEAAAKVERPWLLFEKLKIQQVPDLHPITGMIQPTGRPSAFGYTIRNYGRTPAKVIALYGRIDLSSCVSDPPHPEIYKLPDSTVYPYIIAQNDGREHNAELSPQATDKDILEILSGLLYVWAYAVVRYSDVHGNVYETRICYRNDAGITDLRLDGPSEYNKAS
jgi:hypothetical protein